MFKSIIIEDEPLAASLLERYTSDFDGVQNMATFRNAIEAKSYLMDHEVDLIFLDLHLPQVKGLDFLDTLEKSYYVILTTAYSDYALEGFEKGVMDYLLKPILYSRFELAMNRLTALVSKQLQNENIITIQVNKTKLKLKETNITYIESNRGYVNVFDIDEQMYRTKMTTQTINKLLSESFVRIHKSYIVNKKYVTTLSSSELIINNKNNLPIGRKYKEEVISNLSRDFQKS